MSYRSIVKTLAAASLHLDHYLDSYTKKAFKNTTEFTRPSAMKYKHSQTNMISNSSNLRLTTFSTRSRSQKSIPIYGYGTYKKVSYFRLLNGCGDMKVKFKNTNIGFVSSESLTPRKQKKTFVKYLRNQQVVFQIIPHGAYSHQPAMYRMCQE